MRWLLENHASMMLMSDWNSIESVGVEMGLNRVVSSAQRLIEQFWENEERQRSLT